MWRSKNNAARAKKNSGTGFGNRLRRAFTPRRDPVLLDRVRRSIERVREPMDRPREDMTTPEMDVFLCDLCLTRARSGEINQCSLCGRWICLDGCLDEDDGVCRSCASVVRIQRESVQRLLAAEGNEDVDGGDDDAATAGTTGGRDSGSAPAKDKKRHKGSTASADERKDGGRNDGTKGR